MNRTREPESSGAVEHLVDLFHLFAIGAVGLALTWWVWIEANAAGHTWSALDGVVLVGGVLFFAIIAVGGAVNIVWVWRRRTGAGTSQRRS